MKNFSGNVLFLDRSDINTDEIIPAKYLTEISKQALKPYLLEDIKLEGFNSQRDVNGKHVIVTRANFGCGSSREHAPWALGANNIHLVIAENFARIFRQNMFNCGMMAAELPGQTIDDIFKESEKLLAEYWDEKATRIGRPPKACDANTEVKAELEHENESLQKELALKQMRIDYLELKLKWENERAQERQRKVGKQFKKKKK